MGIFEWTLLQHFLYPIVLNATKVHLNLTKKKICSRMFPDLLVCVSAFKSDWSVCYQHVSSVFSRLSGQADSQPLVIAVCLARLPARLHLCAQNTWANSFTGATSAAFKRNAAACRRRMAHMTVQLCEHGRGAGKGHLRPFHKLQNTFKPGWDDTLTITGVFSLARPRKSCNFVLPLHESVISLIGRQNMWLDYAASLQGAKLSLGQLQR